MNQLATAKRAGGMLPESNLAGRQVPGSVRTTMPLAGQWQKGRRVYEYRSGSWGSHLLFGVGTLAFLTVPSMLPGITVTALIKGYIGLLVAGYGIICVWGMFRAMRGLAAGTTKMH